MNEQINDKQSHHNPTQKRVANNIALFTDRLDTAENTNPPPNATCSTFLRPHVSPEMNPQKCDVITTPMKATALIRPCSLVEMSNSHRAAGNANAMPTPSETTLSSAKPVTSKSTSWKRPFPLQ